MTVSRDGEKKTPKTGKNIVVRGGTYYFRKTINGKTYNVSTGISVRGKSEYDLAEKRARQIENDINEGRFGFRKEENARPSYTVGAWCDKMVGAQRSSVKLTTFLGLQNTSRLLQETPIDGDIWQSRALDSITETDCRALQTALRFTVHKSQNTQRTFHSIAQSIFQRAVKEKVLDSNPWAFAKPKAKPRERVLTVADEARVFPLLSPYHQRVFTLETQCGLRVGCELVQLKAADIQFERRQVVVRQGKGSKLRIVPLTDEAAQALREQLAANAMGEPGVGVVTARVQRQLDAGYVFPGSPRMALRAWGFAADAASVEPFTSHDLRRTYGTRCAESGVPMKKLQMWMGHSDISITAKFYVHLGTEGDATLIDRMMTMRKEAQARETAGVTEDVTPLRIVEKS